MIIYVARDGVEIGQYTRQDFEHLLSRDRLFYTDHFWCEGMEDWKPLTAAKGYFCQQEKCRHCGAKMSEPKMVTAGARTGQMRTICKKCGHAEFHPAAEEPPVEREEVIETEEAVVAGAQPDADSPPAAS